MSAVQVTGTSAYTEAKHTAYADVTGADPMDAGGRQFDPGRITVHYDWRTQLGHTSWNIDRIEISGRWLPKAAGEEPPPGSGAVLVWMAIAPQWARSFAEANMPTSALVAAGGKDAE